MPKCRSVRRRERACNRRIPSPGTLEVDSFHPESDACDARQLWCFAACLSPILPPIAHATRRGRCVCAFNIPLGRLRRSRLLERVLPCGSDDLVCRRPELRAAVVSAGATLYVGHGRSAQPLQTLVPTKSSSVGDSRPRTRKAQILLNARAARNG